MTGEKVAIKRMQNVFDNVADAQRILREIKLLRLLKHPGAPAVGVRAGGSPGMSNAYLYQHTAAQAKRWARGGGGKAEVS